MTSGEILKKTLEALSHTRYGGIKFTLQHEDLVELTIKEVLFRITSYDEHSKNVSQIKDISIDDGDPSEEEATSLSKHSCKHSSIEEQDTKLSDLLSSRHLAL